MFYTVLGIIISIGGFVSGIVCGSQLHNFFFCLCVWVGTFLSAAIYFGIGHVMRKQKEMMLQINETRSQAKYTINETVPIIIDNKPKVDENKAKNQNENLVKCPVCGKLQKRFRTDCWSCGTKLTDGQ